MKKMKDFYGRYKHALPLLLYFAVYMTWFTWLEKTNVRNYQVIHVTLDDYIPFCEVFVVPYLLWFAYIAVVIVYLFFKNKRDYYRLFAFLATGMTIFLLVSTLWPNGHHLRPAVLPRENCFTYLVDILWKTDTPTNLWPSIHVFNSMGAHFAIMRNQEIASHKHGTALRAASGIMALSIILSTVFIKQHSLFDVATALLLGSIMYVLVYRREWLVSGNPAKRNKRTPQAG